MLFVGEKGKGIKPTVQGGQQKEGRKGKKERKKEQLN